MTLEELILLLNLLTSLSYRDVLTWSGILLVLLILLLFYFIRVFTVQLNAAHNFRND